MMFDCPLSVGDLVFDRDPYKMYEEDNLGYGIVVEILNDDYVIVHWISIDYLQAVNIGYVKLIE
jgi:hypothetical protein